MDSDNAAENEFERRESDFVFRLSKALMTCFGVAPNLNTALTHSGFSCFEKNCWGGGGAWENPKATLQILHPSPKTAWLESLGPGSRLELRRV